MVGQMSNQDPNEPNPEFAAYLKTLPPPDCPFCKGTGLQLLGMAVIEDSTPLIAGAAQLLKSLADLLATAQRPATPATANALQEDLKRFAQAVENVQSVPIAAWKILDDGQQRIALISLANAIIISFMKAIARENPRRIILPGRPR
jgi:hypothetical protein